MEISSVNLRRYNCERKTISELKAMCRNKGKTGYSRMKKDELVEYCCVEASMEDIEKSRAREEERRKEAEREREERKKMLEERKAKRKATIKAQFDEEIGSIKPSNIKKIKKKSDYDMRKIKSQTSLIDNISRETRYYGPDPVLYWY